MAKKEIDMSADRVVATNKVARRNYDIGDTYEAGIVLRGSEVKAMREAAVQIKEAYARFEDGELWLIGMHIAPYARAGTQGLVDPTRKRKLLLHRQQLQRINSKVDIEQLTVVPMKLYFSSGRAKLEIGLGRGRKTIDKRQMIAKRDADRDARKELSDRTKYGG